MNADILPFPGTNTPTQPISHIIRIGNTGHRQLEAMHEKGQFNIDDIVVDAAKIRGQKDLINALRATGTQIILDTNAAELSVLGRFDGAVRSAPWAGVGEGNPLQPKHFDPKSPVDVISQIARFAVEQNVDAVLSPGHLLISGCLDEWFEVDRVSCVALRDALDREGGKHIRIDYMLIPTFHHLRDEAMQMMFLHDLQQLPFDNLWIRTSGFGFDSSPVGVAQYIKAMQKFKFLEKPLVADYLGGIVGWRYWLLAW